MPNLITTEALAELLSVPTKTVTDWRARNVGPDYIRVGKHVRYRTEAVEKWLDAKTNAKAAH